MYGIELEYRLHHHSKSAYYLLSDSYATNNIARLSFIGKRSEKLYIKSIKHYKKYSGFVSGGFFDRFKNNLIINLNSDVGIKKISKESIKENKHLKLDMLYYI